MSDTVIVWLDGKMLGLAVPHRSNATDKKDKYEEDLAFGAREALEEARRWRGVDLMMVALRPIAEHFEVDRGELLGSWARHYGPTLMIDRARLR